MSSEHHYHFINLKGSNFHSYGQGLFLLLWFIAILIFVPSFFLCVLLCHRRFSQQHNSAATTTLSPLHDHQKVRVDFTNNTLFSSTTTKVDEGFEKKECCICLSLFQDGERLKVLTQCQHAYHSECLDMWLRAHPSCPLCRASLNVSNSLMKKSDV
ncbi:RING-H2 finger protein ATL66-like [Abrus precatorius]|uniref:RING-H2 finger protein ATL66-like n=1 Tax=Abrus precatorius TaxID=3816 RepID=A0A8B8K367_ABRPR|nr:RING-H2 finger protein ATL66-like [Abrus precatorius]